MEAKHLNRIRSEVLEAVEDHTNDQIAASDIQYRVACSLQGFNAIEVTMSNTDEAVLLYQGLKGYYMTIGGYAIHDVTVHNTKTVIFII